MKQKELPFNVVDDKIIMKETGKKKEVKAVKEVEKPESTKGGDD